MKRLDRKGFTILEVMMALIIAAIMLYAVNSVFSNFYKAYLRQERGVDLQQGVRAALEQMSAELRMTGYFPNGNAIEAAAATDIKFQGDFTNDGTPRKVRYWQDTAAKELRKQSWEFSAGSWTPTTGDLGSASGALVAERVTTLNFTYYDIGNAPTSDLTKITRVRVLLEAEAALEAGSNASRSPKISVTSDIRLRDMQLGLSGADLTPPAVPTGLAVTNPGLCGVARASWNANSESDLAGYKFYYRLFGVTSWFVVDRPGTSTTYDLGALVNGSTYEFSLSAYDTAGNVSGLVSPVVPLTLSDTTAPNAPTGLDATASSSGSTVTLTWTASSSSDVTNTHIERSGNGGTTWTEVGTVGATTTFADTAPKKCVIYWYRIRAKDGCSNFSAYTSAVHGDDGLQQGESDVPVNGTTNTRPSDLTAPSDPTALVAIAGGQNALVPGPNNYKITLSWTHASDSDVVGTRIRYRESNSACAANDYPSSATSSSGPGSGGTILADVSGSPGASESNTYSVFRNNKYYCFAAFAYDECTNYSVGTQATAQAKTCGDDPVGPPPPLAANALKLGDAYPGGSTTEVKIEWTYSGTQTTIPDLVGFNVWRDNPTLTGQPSMVVNNVTYYRITDAPIFFPATATPNFVDPNRTAGQTYRYVVTVVDCMDNNSTASNVVTAKPGTFAQDTSTAVQTKGRKDDDNVDNKKKNIVKYGIKNTSGSDLVIRNSTFAVADTGTVTWSRVDGQASDARLRRIRVGGTILWTESVSPPPLTSPATVTFTGTKTVLGSATAVEVEIEFRTSTGSKEIDMRNYNVTLSFKFRNQANFDGNGGDETKATGTASITVTTAPGVTISTKQIPPDANPPNNVLSTATSTTGSYVVEAGSSVTVQSVVTPPSGVTITSVTLFYRLDSQSATSPPDPDITPYTAVTMTALGGNTYQGSIPASPKKRIWYYVNAIDSTGSHSSDPGQALQASFVAFTYDQKGRLNVNLVGAFVVGDKVSETVTVTDQDSVAVSGATVDSTFTGSVGTPVPSETNSGGLTNASGVFSYTTTTAFPSPNNVTVSVTVKKSAYSDKTCSVIVPAGSSVSLNCP